MHTGSDTAKQSTRPPRNGRGNAHIVEHAERGKNLRHLERARNPQLRDLARRSACDFLVLEEDRALARFQMPGDHVDESRLAGAVRADHADGLLGRHTDGNVARGYQRTEGLFQIANRENGRAAGSHGFAPARPRRRPMSEPSPSGRNRIVSKSAEPRVICHKDGMRSTAMERTASKSSEPMKAAATEADPARMVMKTKLPDVVQYAIFGSTWPMVSAASAPPRPPRTPAITTLAWMTRVTETPRNSTRISLSRMGAARAPVTERK